MNEHGYGSIATGNRAAGGLRGYAHRLSYETFVGPIPQGLELDHLCRVPQCVNPDHLEPVTHQENQRRGYSPMAVNARKTHCKRGHELSGGNVYVQPSTGYRKCRACAALRRGGG